MPNIRDLPLGFSAAKHVVAVGRAAFFDSLEADLPRNRSIEIAQDDLIPQFGYVGAQYEANRVLLLGINPGNGPNDIESAGDAMMMPALRQFAQSPKPSIFARAQAAYRSVCQAWPVWGRHCGVLLEEAALSLDQIAYSNCLPWRTASKSAFDDQVAKKAAELYTAPLIQELSPSLIVAVGKRAATILSLAKLSLPPVVVWNRAQALTAAVAREREQAGAALKTLLSPSSREKAT